MPKVVGERRIDGVLLMDLLTDDARLPAIRALDLPAVAIGPPHASGGLPAVWSDDAASVHEIVRYLATLGHRRIARVAGPAELAHGRHRPARRVPGGRHPRSRRGPHRLHR
ncbi:hypothetical protein [Streptomyces sp. C8S0]|uniref:hypothetical protein n=1 Tax=Streptomyces sp. C8S0 TaxID=2585716 RepID=UPI001D03D1C0|nr:hypothetical protein [Streptomyces sp. C8S0]